MAFVFNILWFVFGGILSAMVWILIGLAWCLTVVGIPFGVACFRIAPFAAFPFGRRLIPGEWVGQKRIAGTGLANFLWVAFFGLWLAIGHAVIGIACIMTIIGIPAGIANFNLAQASFAPLGKVPVPKSVADEAERQYARRRVDAGLARS